MKQSFWHRDWFFGLIVVIFVTLAAANGLFQGVERNAYDLGVQQSAGLPHPDVAVIAIDDYSIENIGRWPWSRDKIAQLITQLQQGGAKVIGNSIFFLEPQLDPGLQYINDARLFLKNSSLNESIKALRELDKTLNQQASLKPRNATKKYLNQLNTQFANSPLSGQLTQDLIALDGKLRSASQALSTDNILAASLAKARNVVLAMPFELGYPQGNPDKPLANFVTNNAIPIANVSDNIGAFQQGLTPIPTIKAHPPIENLGKTATAIGHLNTYPDVDGAVRTEPLILGYYDQFYPSISLLLAAKSLNLSSEDIKIRLGEGIDLGRLRIDTDQQLQMRTFYYSGDNGQSAFTVDSFYDVINNRIPVEKYRGKIVLIGATAIGLGSNQVTPISSAMPPVLTLAHSVSSILNEDFYTKPESATLIEISIYLLVALYLILLLPHLKAGMAASLSLAIALVLFSTEYILLTGSSLWLELMLPIALLLIGHALLTTKRFLVTERGKLKSDAESAESNRMLGLAFQGQGQLDMAFEKFRKVPLDDTVMEVLYNLALDFERKRQFNKAMSVYQYMAKHDANFRDVKQRLSRSKAMDETVLIGGAGSAAGTLLIDGDDIQKPMLGRYEVQKELGKGAMGVVYLGKDPKISRVVAIKTMALSQEFEEDELGEVKERFFREAETAGRLSHPNIVTIFDAGEEQDLAYIAMEFLKGKDLAGYTKQNNLLPVKQVIDMMARCAEALHYAHQQNVVHRDIKPANVMYELTSDELKITDFGIARITDSSKTKTGMVLGTPSYMSPEQLSGHKVDGRSDLFSLGVMLFQLLSGRLPFQADSMAALMFKIANEPHPDVSVIRPELPNCVVAVIDKALAKEIDNRYQNGNEMAHSLKECIKMINE